MLYRKKKKKAFLTARTGQHIRRCRYNYEMPISADQYIGRALLIYSFTTQIVTSSDRKR